MTVNPCRIHAPQCGGPMSPSGRVLNQRPVALEYLILCLEDNPSLLRYSLLI